jgi:formate dehydrogenase beta subunit
MPFPGSRRDCGIEFDKWGLPLIKDTFQSTVPKVFFGGDAALAPRTSSRLWHMAMRRRCQSTAYLNGEDMCAVRPPPSDQSDVGKKWAFTSGATDNDVSNDSRFKVPWAKAEVALASIRVEVELGFDAATAFKEASRCLNCDVQTVFNRDTCIECDACVDICPMDCITFTANGDEADLRTRLKAPAPTLSRTCMCRQNSRPGT